MKSIYIYIAVLFFSFSFSQKKELRQIKRLIDEKFFQEAESLLDSNKDFLLSGDSKTDSQYYYYATKIYTETESFVLATSSLEKLMSINTSFYNSEMKLDYKNLEEILVVALVNSAVADNSSKKWMQGVDKLLLAYDMNKETNIDYLYFAASGAVNAENFDLALEYYLTLKEKSYTGIIDEYFITNVQSGVEEKVTETEYKIYQSSKEYINPRIGQTESRYPEIVKNIALIYVKKGEDDLAIEAINEARSIQPDDLYLILNEADLYIRLSNNATDDNLRSQYRQKFKDIMTLAVEKDPKNGILYYNLGIISSEQGESADAKSYFEKAIEFKPDYVDSYVAIVNILLEEQSVIISDMDKIAMSNKRSDIAKYDQLKEDLNDVWRKCIPYCEMALEYDPNDVEVLKLLSQFYYKLDNIDGYKKINAKIEELSN
ncbi:MAG: tetratricopeptide repeat protein [Flavobacteriaceae bacterium]|tara:strand:- start:1219 stop:2511 length:1293 start_codon:yes stop_codon:yes gene_type:complete